MHLPRRGTDVAGSPCPRSSKVPSSRGAGRCDNRPMLTVLFTAIFTALTALLSGAAQPALTGEWALEFTTPLGHAEYTMYLLQEGPRITGHLTSEYGEHQLRVTVSGDEIRISWSETENGKTLDIVLTGTVKNDSMTGTAKLGSVGEGPFKAERTDG